MPLQVICSVFGGMAICFLHNHSGNKNLVLSCHFFFFFGKTTSSCRGGISVIDLTLGGKVSWCFGTERTAGMHNGAMKMDGELEVNNL